MHERLSTFLNDYDRFHVYANADVIDCLRRHAWLADVAATDLTTLLEELAKRPAPAPQSMPEALLAATLAQVSLPYRKPHRKKASALPMATRELASALYRHLGPASRARHELLTLLAAAQGEEDLRTLANLTAADPPAVAQTFLTPLFQRCEYDPAPLFPKLLDAVEHLSVAAAVLDLCNFLTRTRRMPVHPATSRDARIAALLGELIQQLNAIAENPPPPEETEETHRRVEQSVALSVSLCDALALIGDREHVGKLYQALELPHRRVRTEAAYALAKLGEKAGEEALVALAAEPVARLRVLAYAQELGLTDRIAEVHRSAQAQAEAELVAWLTDPTQMGLPPGESTLIDRRTQYWPGYDDPVECFLFHFAYRLGGAVYSNVGIVGPLTHALTADLADLPPDDIYAAFAGWQAEHEDLYEVDVDRLTAEAGREAERLVRRLHDAGYEKIEPVKLGYFFGDRVLVAQARRDGVSGCAVVDAQDIDWRPAGARVRPLGPDEVYYIYKGRKLLQAFNP